jgi:hypothetical protein
MKPKSVVELLKPYQLLYNIMMMRLDEAIRKEYKKQQLNGEKRKD